MRKISVFNTKRSAKHRIKLGGDVREGIEGQKKKLVMRPSIIMINRMVDQIKGFKTEIHCYNYDLQISPVFILFYSNYNLKCFVVVGRITSVTS